MVKIGRRGRRRGALLLSSLFLLMPILPGFTGCSALLGPGGSAHDLVITTSFNSDYIRVPGPMSVREFAAKVGVPAPVIAVINRRNTDAELRGGEQLEVPAIAEVFPRFTLSTAPGLFHQTSLGDETATRISHRFMWPVLGGRISSHFGPRRGRPHAGVDIRAPEGNPVFAPAAAVVTKVGYDSRGYGWFVDLAHTVRPQALFLNRDARTQRSAWEQGPQQVTMIASRYAHLSAVLVAEGEPVEQGTPLGLVGRTGNATGAHLHFEVGGGARDRGFSKGSQFNPLLMY